MKKKSKKFNEIIAEEDLYEDEWEDEYDEEWDEDWGEDEDPTSKTLVNEKILKVEYDYDEEDDWEYFRSKSKRNKLIIFGAILLIAVSILLILKYKSINPNAIKISNITLTVPEGVEVIHTDGEITLRINSDVQFIDETVYLDIEPTGSIIQALANTYEDSVVIRIPLDIIREDSEIASIRYSEQINYNINYADLLTGSTSSGEVEIVESTDPGSYLITLPTGITSISKPVTSGTARVTLGEGFIVLWQPMGENDTLEIKGLVDKFLIRGNGNE